MAFIKNLTSAQIIVRGNKMKQKHLLPIYSFINNLTNICYTSPKASGSVRDCISQGLKSKQMVHSNQDHPRGVYLQKGFIEKVWPRRDCRNPRPVSIPLSPPLGSEGSRRGKSQRQSCEEQRTHRKEAQGPDIRSHWPTTL